MKIFIDDERFPISDDFIILRNYEESIEFFETTNEPISFISFDHDIQSEPFTGYDIVKWIIEKDMDMNGVFLSSNFDFYVHSMNPIGKKNIENLLKNYLDYKKTLLT